MVRLICQGCVALAMAQAASQARWMASSDRRGCGELNAIGAERLERPEHPAPLITVVAPQRRTRIAAFACCGSGAIVGTKARLCSGHLSVQNGMATIRMQAIRFAITIYGPFSNPYWERERRGDQSAGPSTPRQTSMGRGTSPHEDGHMVLRSKSNRLEVSLRTRASPKGSDREHFRRKLRTQNRSALLLESL
jgi:hypothetical protein